MYEDIIFIQNEKNKELADKLASKGIKNLRITSVGNSIASGYSMMRTIKPLLLRNESLKEEMEKKNITLEVHNFSRAQNNNDEHVFEWLIANITENEINRYNRMDYSNGPNSMSSNGITQEQIENFYDSLENSGVEIIDNFVDDGLDDIDFMTGDGSNKPLVYNSEMTFQKL